MITRVLVDANVLFSRTLRDWLLMLYLETSAGMFTLHWTEDILAEVVYHLRRTYPNLDGGAITAVRDKIAAALEGGRVDDFTIDPSFAGDPDDNHVHGAALACGATTVLTVDAGYAGAHDHELLPYEIQRPDTFFVLIDDAAPEAVARVAERQARHFWETRGESDLCGRLRDAGCHRFADRVRKHLQHVDPEAWPRPSRVGSSQP